jgi:hypothetical protein
VLEASRIDELIDPGMGCCSAQAQDREESLIDSPHLLGCQMTGKIAQSAGVDGSDLFD